jgi:hypothetical protein
MSYAQSSLGRPKSVNNNMSPPPVKQSPVIKVAEDPTLTSVSPSQIIVPVNVYALNFEGAKDLNSRWGESEATELVTQLNNIYKPFGITWKINNTSTLKISANQYKSVHFPESLKSFVNKVSGTLGSPGTGPRTVPSIFVIKTFPEGADEVAKAINSNSGVLFAEQSAVSGKGNPIILAHELGLVLGLKTIPPNESNLMSINRPKTIQGAKLYAPQISQLRKIASQKAQASKTALASTSETIPSDSANTSSSVASTKNTERKNTPTIFRQIGTGQDF